MIKFKTDAIAIGIGAGSAPAPAPGRLSILPKISKPFRIGLVALACVLGVWLYWMHLVGITHVHAAATQAAAATTAAKATVAAGAAKTAPVSASTPESAREQVLAVWTYVLESIKAAPIQAAAKPAPSAPAQPAAPVAAKAAAVATAPKVPAKPLTDQDRLLQAAQVAFHNVMDQASAYPDSYGFQADDVLVNAHLGSPMPVYTVAEKDCVSYQAGQPLKPLLKPADQWVFPVSIGDRVCCMVQVSHVGHNFVPGGGNKMLGQAWNKITQKWSAADGYHPELVMNPNVPGYYFTIPELPTQNLTDIIRMFEYETDLSPAAVIMASWR